MYTGKAMKASHLLNPVAGDVEGLAYLFSDCLIGWMLGAGGRVRGGGSVGYGVFVASLKIVDLLIYLN